MLGKQKSMRGKVKAMGGGKAVQKKKMMGGGKAAAKKVMGMKSGKAAPKKMMGGGKTAAKKVMGMRSGKKVSKLKKMKSGGVCRGMGAATQGGNFEVV